MEARLSCRRKGARTVQRFLGRVTPRVDCALHVRSRHPDLGGELRNPDGPDDLGERLLYSETLVEGGQKEGAGKRAVAEPLRKIPVFTTSCYASPPRSHANTLCAPNIFLLRGFTSTDVNANNR